MTMAVVKNVGKLHISRNQLNLQYTLDGGQAFRWQKDENSLWTGVFAHRLWLIRQEDEFISYEAFGSSELTKQGNDMAILSSYLRIEEPIEDLYMKWSMSDSKFGEACGKFSGIRILQQDPIETIFSYICSSNNNITRIKLMVNKLCQLYGERIIENADGISYYDFPTIEKLAQPCVVSDLRDAAFGYRAKYIYSAACQIIDFGGLDWICNLRKLPYQSAKADLTKLTGVGSKVADCICLMSLGHLEAIPVDTHVYQIACKYLPHLKEKKVMTNQVYNEIGDYFRSLYGNYAGWAHSVLFCSDLRMYQKDDDKTHVKEKRRRKSKD